nr:AIR carboxylase family protein [Clostridiales bacterium]
HYHHQYGNQQTGNRRDGSSGIPVATVAVDGAKNAAFLAAEIIAVDDADLAGKLDAIRAAAAEEVMEKDRKIGENRQDA